MPTTMESLVAETPTPAPLDYTPAEIQGNIVHAFGRQYATYVFFRFVDDAALVRQNLKSLLSEIVTSATKQTEVILKMKKDQATKVSEGFCMFGLSGSGYRHLHLYRYVPPDPNGDGTPFEEGLKDWDNYAWVENKGDWEPKYLRSPIHCFLLLADDDLDRLKKSVQSAVLALRETCVAVAEEDGNRLKNAAKKVEYEHYGLPEINPELFDPAKVLIAEGTEYSSGPGKGCFASFLKLEQDVAKFHTDSQDMALKPGVTANAHEVRELCLGRDYEGNLLGPTSFSETANLPFNGVPEGMCPAHAHVRAMRHHEDEKARLIVRRGISYGAERPDIENPDSNENLPVTGSGLLFLSLQRTLWDFITLMGRSQKLMDPILARSDPQDTTKAQSWTFGSKSVTCPMMDFTTIRGGEYFFIPSMLFIDNLK